MKVSIAWIFDHIDADWRTIDIKALIKRFNETTAEIEGWYPVSVDPKNLFIGTARSQNQCVLIDTKKEVSLPVRTDVQIGKSYVIKKNGNTFSWATSIDLGGEKEMILPAVKPEAWKKSFEANDYILDIDNKSITHRPDLWGARGFAREIAALLDLKLKPYSSFLAKKSIKHFAKKASGVAGGPSIELHDLDQCRRFAGLYIPKVEHTSSLLWMVTRLSRVDARAIDALVDFTNYVMLDTSQPMHVFDAKKIHTTITARQAKNKEKITLLDDQVLELDKHDIVIADKQGAVSLAGIMGGKYSGVSADTSSLFLESANFDAATIRKTSSHYHVRSEASARFEKSLDPMQNTIAIERFLQLMDDAGIAYTDAPYIASVGKVVKEPTISLSHEFIEKRIGTSIKSTFIKKTLEKIGFKVATQKTGYKITIPFFRATKDIGLAEDIVEEVARFYGYSAIPFVLPERKTQPTNIAPVQHIADLKHELAFSLSMRELYGYAFFDESFLRTFGWEPKKTLEVKDPVSENWYRLVTTLMPQMLKAIKDNASNNDELRFFECGRVWEPEGKHYTERKKLTGIFYHKRKALDFYDIKALLDHMFVRMRMPVEWRSGSAIYPWMSESQTAQLVHDGIVLGNAGMVDTSFLASLAEGHAFIFELDADYLEMHKPHAQVFKPLPKYPAIERDVSMLVPLDVTVASLTNIIANSSKEIVSVELVDFFTKKEWKDQKAITMRYVMRDIDATLTSEQADAISDKVIKVVTKAGATVR